MEIERKFLAKVNYLPDLSKLENYQIEQFYTDFDPIERFRKIIHNNGYEQYYITVKRGNGLERYEEEYAVNKIDYERGLLNKKFNFINKTRFEYVLDKEKEWIAEIDFFENLLDKHGNKLVTIEVEFFSKKEAEEFIPPNWFGKEITYDEYYKNDNLCKL